MTVSDKIKNSKSNIDEDEKELLMEIINAKKNSKRQAGLTQTSDVGGWDDESDVKPTTTIHEFKDLSKCECDCHNLNKTDCEKCYDHPKHLENFKRPTL